MKLSIVIICWNDSEQLRECLASIYAHGCRSPFEVIVTDNQSTDGSVTMVRTSFPQVRVIENARNLGFGGGNNAAFAVAEGEYVLILNPDTVVRPNALDRLIGFADRHLEAGAFGCRMLNPDGSYQRSAYPVPSVRGYLIAALYARWMGWISDWFLSDVYVRWNGSTEREVGFQAGCCLMIRRQLLNDLGGFDERLFHQFEDADLARGSGKRVGRYATVRRRRSSTSADGIEDAIPSLWSSRLTVAGTAFSISTTARREWRASGG